MITKIRCLAVLTALFPAISHAVIEDCSHSVSFSNGNTTKGLTAQVECTVRDAKHIKTRSVGFKNGERHGKTTRYDGYLSGVRNPKNRVIAVENYQNGKKHGKFMQYDSATGRLETETEYSNDISQREVFHRTDGTRIIKFFKKNPHGNWADTIGSVSYNRANQLTDKSCPKQASGKAELDKVCGFGGGTQTTKLHDATGNVVGATTQVNGKVNESKSFYPSGKVKVVRAPGSQKFYYENGNLQEEVLDSANRTQRVTEYYENGKKKKFIHTVERKLKTTQSWYMNGKTEYLVSRQGNTERMSVKTYHGNGRMASEYIYIPHDRYSLFFAHYFRSAKLIGNSRSFYENGRVQHDVRRDHEGVLQLARSYYENGKMSRSEQIHADGTKTIKTFNEDGSVKKAGTYYSDGSLKQ